LTSGICERRLGGARQRRTGWDLAESTQMSEAPKPPKKSKKKPRAAKKKAPMRINITVYELGPNAPRAKELHERQVKAMARFLRPAVIKEWERRKGSPQDR
jgi:hypothetical protein